MAIAKTAGIATLSASIGAALALGFTAAPKPAPKPVPPPLVQNQKLGGAFGSQPQPECPPGKVFCPAQPPYCLETCE